VSPPYFIPVPLWPSFIGTMGAFIRLRTVLSDRRQLFDVGAAGPFAGFAVAVPVLALGLARSEPLPAAEGLQGMVIWFGAMPAEVGDSLVTLALRWALANGAPAIALHPLAFAGWVGMMVTMLNLLPISQLDGGHVLYAALPRWHERLTLVFWVSLFALGWYGWTGWAVWAVVVLAVSRGRLAHPSVLDVTRPLPPSRTTQALGALLLLALTFAPVPFRI
jgi:membrane-associated protease RseP (regulator of RpoE activity)